MKKYIAPIIMLIYAVMMSLLIIKGKMKLYLHPRLYPFLITGIGLLFIIFIFSIHEIMKNKKNIYSVKGMVVFVIPILLMLLPNDVNASQQVALENGIKIHHGMQYEKQPDSKQEENVNIKTDDSFPAKDDNINEMKDNQNIGDEIGELEDNNSIDNSMPINDNNEEQEIINTVDTSRKLMHDEDDINQQTIINQNDDTIQMIEDDMVEDINDTTEVEPIDELEQILSSQNVNIEGQQWKPIEKDGVYYLTEDDFATAIDQIQAENRYYLGHKISYRGLVYKQEDFESDELVIGRMLMFCCAADAQIIGLLGHHPDASNYSDGDWVEFTGTIEDKEYTEPITQRRFTIPYIKIEMIKMLPKDEIPSDPYVYF